jgi:hypothetical protein
MAIPPISLATIAAGTGGYVLRGTSAAFETGHSAASIGDINQDGFIDVIVGAPLAYQNPLEFAAGGLAYVIYGAATAPASPGSLATIASLTGGFLVEGEFFSDPANPDNAGFAVAGGGDINGDGLVDYVVTAPNADGALDANANAGTIYVVFGQLGGPATVHLSDVLTGIGGFAIHGASAADLAGSAIAVGDTNGDGIADLLIGAEGLNVNTGVSYVVFGKATPFAAELNLADIAAGTGGFAMGGEDQTDRAGSATAILDLNGDGIGDYVTGARSADGVGNADAQAGDIYVRFGQTGTPPSTNNLAFISDVIIRGHDGGLGAGTTLAAAGDLNGDGFADLAIGAPYATPPNYGNGNAGLVYVVFGGNIITGDLSNILAGNGGFLIRGDGDLDVAGASLAAAGDVNGDGVDDLLIGAPGALSNMAGKTYVVFGRADGFTNPVNLADIAAGTGGFVITGEEAGDQSGSAVAAGDMNGDGFSDLLIGARSADGVDVAQFAAGDAYIVYGGDFSGAVTHAGDADANDLTGDAGIDNMIGGQGDDIFTGNGGADAMHGGQGNDLMRVADLSFRRVDGGTGIDTLALDGNGHNLALPAVAGQRVRSIETIDLTGSGTNGLVVTALSLMNLSESTNTLRVEGGGDDDVTLQDSGWTAAAGPSGYVTYVNGNARIEINQTIDVIPCFTPGSHITTTEGEIRVEDLREGDIAILADGTRRPIRWIGHRTVQIARHPRPWDVQPIRIRADAFGPGRPYRDLRLSPDHAVFAHGQLVPIRHLINGATIVQEHAGEITYYHVELAAADGTAAHDILLAEGLEVESFLDTGNRAAFANGGPATHLHPDFALRAWEANACAPLLRDGPALADLRTELQAEATSLGWAITPDPDLRLLVDGRPVWPTMQDGRYVIRLPANARTARLRSHRTMPAWLRPDTADTRLLGVAVTHLSLDGTAIALDDPRLGSGWHAPEGDLRWTDGDATLPVAGGQRLEIALASLERYWRAPQARRPGTLARPAGWV